MPRSWESQTMSAFDFHGDSLDLNDQSAAMPTNWPDAGLPNYPDNNHVPLEGVGREINPVNFGHVPQVNSSGSTGYMVSLCAVGASILYRHFSGLPYAMCADGCSIFYGAKRTSTSNVLR
jgi:hypothetical protein